MLNAQTVAMKSRCNFSARKVASRSYLDRAEVGYDVAPCVGPLRPCTVGFRRLFNILLVL